MSSDQTSAEAVNGLADAVDNLNGMAERVGVTLTTAFARGAASGKSFEGVLQTIGQRLVAIGLSTALKPLDGVVGGLVSGAAASLTAALGSARPFASGGVVSAPTYFPLGGGAGLMGEAGAEAILPLARGADGRLGVQSGGGGPVNVTIQTQDLASFRRSEAQVSAALARAVTRGQRGL